MNKSIDTGLGTAIDRAVPLTPRIAIRGERFDGSLTVTTLVTREELGQYVNELLDNPNVMNVEVMKDI